MSRWIQSKIVRLSTGLLDSEKTFVLLLIITFVFLDYFMVVHVTLPLFLQFDGLALSTGTHMYVCGYMYYMHIIIFKIVFNEWCALWGIYTWDFVSWTLSVVYEIFANWSGSFTELNINNGYILLSLSLDLKSGKNLIFLHSAPISCISLCYLLLHLQLFFSSHIVTTIYLKHASDINLWNTYINSVASKTKLLSYHLPIRCTPQSPSYKQPRLNMNL